MLANDIKYSKYSEILLYKKVEEDLLGGRRMRERNVGGGNS